MENLTNLSDIIDKIIFEINNIHIKENFSNAMFMLFDKKKVFVKLCKFRHIQNSKKIDDNLVNSPLIGKILNQVHMAKTTIYFDSSEHNDTTFNKYSLLCVPVRHANDLVLGYLIFANTAKVISVETVAFVELISRYM